MILSERPLLENYHCLFTNFHIFGLIRSGKEMNSVKNFSQNRFDR